MRRSEEEENKVNKNFKKGTIQTRDEYSPETFNNHQPAAVKCICKSKCHCQSAEECEQNFPGQ